MNQPTPYRDGVEPTAHLAVTTGNDVAGYKITNYLGVVRGIVVRSPGFGSAFVGGLKQLVGGNISEYVQVCEQARHEAYTHMVANAQALGAHAIIGMRYDATEFSPQVTEVLAYGTAVTVERL
jgi:uncharacterized protein YbjQ (UPF0145 family)